MKIDKGTILYWASVIITIFIFFYPIWTALMGGIKTIAQFDVTKVFLPPMNPTFEPFIEAWEIVNQSMIASFTIATLTMLFCIAFGLMGGYLLSKVDFRYSNYVLAIMVFGIYIPGVTKLIPILKVIQSLQLYNTSIGVAFALASVQLPLVSLLYRQFFRAIPDSLIESAQIQGADHLQIFRYIIIPMSTIPTTAVGILTFTMGWNNLLFPLILTSGPPSNRPAMVAVATFRRIAFRRALYNQMLAAGILAAIPVIILYFVFQRYIQRSYAEFAVSG